MDLTQKQFSLNRVASKKQIPVSRVSNSVLDAFAPVHNKPYGMKPLLLLITAALLTSCASKPPETEQYRAEYAQKRTAETLRARYRRYSTAELQLHAYALHRTAGPHQAQF